MSLDIYTFLKNDVPEEYLTFLDINNMPVSVYDTVKQNISTKCLNGLSFNSDIYYYMLGSTFEEILHQTGQHIHLFEADAIFFKDTLLRLKEILLKSLDRFSKIKEGENIWKMKKTIFTNSNKYKEIEEIASKKKLIQIINQFLELIEIAIQKEGGIICFGEL